MLSYPSETGLLLTLDSNNKLYFRSATVILQNFLIGVIYREKDMLIVLAEMAKYLNFV